MQIETLPVHRPCASLFRPLGLVRWLGPPDAGRPRQAVASTPVPALTPARGGTLQPGPETNSSH